MFHLSYQRKDLAVQITVQNTNGDDAYEAKLLATFSKTLSYSGVRSHPATVSEAAATSCGHMCALNLNGSNIIVLCPLSAFGIMIHSMEVSRNRKNNSLKIHIFALSSQYPVSFAVKYTNCVFGQNVI